jgi:hypothetical protein
MKITVVVTTQFRGFGTPPIVETVTTSSTPKSKLWSATLERISRETLARHYAQNPLAYSARAALQNGATVR